MEEFNTIDELKKFESGNYLNFFKGVDNMSPKEIVQEYITHNLEYVDPVDVLCALRASPSKLMENVDLQFYETLPDMVTIYRGCSQEEANFVDEDGCLGLSWSLSYDIALWFATRFELPNMCVIKALVPKNWIRYYTNDRKEEEVLVVGPVDNDFQIVWKN